jgi:hypothetical protein
MSFNKKQIEKKYSFQVLVATIGRSTLQNLLNSLIPQLEYKDCLTVVFDGFSSIPDKFDFSQFNCKVNLFFEKKKLGHWGHEIRNKYAELLEERDFVMHADDDNIYINNSFDLIKNNLIDKETLHIFQIQHREFIFPTENTKIIKRGNIDTACGIIPFDINKKGKWALVFGGDGAFYEDISKCAKNISFFNTVIYLMRPHVQLN